MSEQEHRDKKVWRFRFIPATLGIIWLLIGIAVAERVSGTRGLTWSLSFAWFIMFGFPCLILFKLSFYRVQIHDESDGKPYRVEMYNEPDGEPVELKYAEFVDRHGRKMRGTPDQVKEWKKIDEALQDNFIGWHPRDFEEFVTELFRRMGYEAQLTPYVRDYGADIALKKDNRRIVVQIKKYPPEHLVNYEEIKDTLGAIPYFRADKAIFITTSDFTDEAITYAQNKPIELWNFRMLEELVEKYLMRTVEKSALEKKEGVSYTGTVETPSESNDFYKEAYPELSEEEAELQETQEVDMDFEDEEDCTHQANCRHLNVMQIPVFNVRGETRRVVKKCADCGKILETQNIGR